MTESSFRRAADRIESLGRGVEDSRALRLAVLEEIRRSLPFDAYAWLLTDPETEVGSDPLADVPCMPELPRLIRLKYLTAMNRWTSLSPPVGLLRAATQGRLEQSLVWRELLSRYQVGDVASVVFRDRFGCWGFLDLWRIGRSPAFSERDGGLLGAIAPKITEAIRRCQANTFTAVQPTVIPAGPVVLVLSPELEVRAQTPETEGYLRALLPPDGDRRPVPAGAYNVGAQLLAFEGGVDRHRPWARVHLTQGAWLSLRASRIAGPTGDANDIAVTIEAASPAERMDLFGRAHGLSRRETELMTALLRGSDTRELAGGLFVSENTVQDHLKSIFVKTGTRSRPALVARVLGS